MGVGETKLKVYVENDSGQRLSGVTVRLKVFNLLGDSYYHEITDDQGYFEAMAKPVIAVVKRDALIAEAEADREARIKAAGARREAQQAELDADRAIIEQRQALELREVEKASSD